MSEKDLLKRIDELERRVADLENALNTISMIDKLDRIAEYLKNRQRSQRFISLVNTMTDEQLGIRGSESENEKRLADERERLEKQIQAAIESEKNAVLDSIESEGLFSISDYSYGVEITGYNGFNPNTIVVPSIIKGKTVIRIGNKAFSNISCQSVVLPDTVKEIGEGAFEDCKQLKKVNLPKNLEQLGKRSLSGSGIIKIIIPGSVKTIPFQCFSICSQLKEIVIGEGVTSVEGNAFFACNLLKEIILPKSILTVDAELLGFNPKNMCKLVFLGNNTDLKYSNDWHLANKSCVQHQAFYCPFGSKILHTSRRLGYEVHPITEYFDNK